MLAIILISSLGIIVYSNTLFCSFHFDDDAFIVNNYLLQDIHNLAHIWGFWHCRFFTFLTFALNYHFNGLHVVGYHVFNIAVHIITAILVWWLTLLTLATPALKEDKISQDAKLIALLAGLIFVSHPIQTEAITYIWQRAASMAAMFYLASVCLYVKSRLLQINNSRPDLVNFYYFGSLATAVLAMFSKENTITLPLMILFYEFSFLNIKQNLDLKRLVPFLLTIFIIPVTLLFSQSEAFHQHHGDLRVPGGVITTGSYFITEFRVMFTYIRLLFMPLNQNIDYDYPLYKSIFEWPIFISFLFLTAIIYWAIRLFSKYRLISFSIFWFFLTLTIPESSFFAMGDVVSEYRLYLPSVGFCLFLVSGVYYLFGKNSIKVLVVVLSLFIACNSILTYQRNKVWKNDFTLWNDAAIKSPHKARPYNNRSAGETSPGDLILNYNKAIFLDPDNPLYYFNLGVIYQKLGKDDKALIEYAKALLINSNYYPAYNLRGTVYARRGQFTLALNEYSQAIKRGPNFVPTYFNRCQLYVQLKEYDKALADLRKLEELGYAVDPGLVNDIKNHMDKANK